MTIVEPHSRMFQIGTTLRLLPIRRERACRPQLPRLFVAAVVALGIAAAPARSDSPATAALAAQSAAAETPRSETVRIGMSTPLTGPSAYLGQRARFGVALALDEFNRRPGNRRRVELVVLDDGFEPMRTAPNMRRLIDRDQVAAVLANVGAPGAVVAAPIASESRTPLVGYVSGGEALRKQPPDRYVINYRASLAEEAEALVGILVDEMGIAPEAVAFFSQRDDSGDTFHAAGVEALRRRGYSGSIVAARYERNTAAVQSGLSEILLHDKPVRAIAVAAALKPCAAIVREARAAGFGGLFGAVSFADANELRRELGSAAEGIVVTQVVPHVDSTEPAAAEFRKLSAGVSESYADSFIALEGFIAARMLCRALDAIPGSVDREKLTAALLDLRAFDLGVGVTMRLTPADHQASHAVWSTVIRGGEVRPLLERVIVPGASP